MNSQLPRFTAHTPLNGRRKIAISRSSVCQSESWAGNAGTSLLTSCFCSCSLEARHDWSQPRSLEQSQSQVFAHPGAAQGDANRTTSTAPLLSVLVTFTPLFFPSFFNVLTIDSSSSTPQSPCEGSQEAQPHGHPGTVSSGGSSVDQGSILGASPWALTPGHCWSKNLECTGLWSPPEWMVFNYLLFFLIFAHGCKSTMLEASHKICKFTTLTSFTAL